MLIWAALMVVSGVSAVAIGLLADMNSFARYIVIALMAITIIFALIARMKKTKEQAER